MPMNWPFAILYTAFTDKIVLQIPIEQLLSTMPFFIDLSHIEVEFYWFAKEYYKNWLHTQESAQYVSEYEFTAWPLLFTITTVVTAEIW